MVFPDDPGAFRVLHQSYASAVTPEEPPAAQKPTVHGVTVPAAAARGFAVVLVVLALASPWLATWSGLLQRPVEATSDGVAVLRPELVLLPAGAALLGSPDHEARDADEVEHMVELDGFYMCRTEVTVAQWRGVMGTAPAGCEGGCADDEPARSVEWSDAVRYMNKLTELERVAFGATWTACYAQSGATWTRVDGCTGYRLPTEAEWEYAARAGTRTAYSFGDDAAGLCAHANIAGQAVCDDGQPRAAPVGVYVANPWGLHDMHGNVWEWTSDWYGEYPRIQRKDPRGPATGRGRVSRGGSFRSPPNEARSANRSEATSGALDDQGLRCARSAPT